MYLIVLVPRVRREDKGLQNVELTNSSATAKISHSTSFVSLYDRKPLSASRLMLHSLRNPEDILKNDTFTQSKNVTKNNLIGITECRNEFKTSGTN